MKITLKINLKNLIISKGYTVKSFAEEVGVARETMHRICSGRDNVYGVVMFKIADLLGRRVDEIWELTRD